MPAVTALEANGAAWHACGASEAQELALILATLVTYLRACEAQGLTPSRALPKVSVNVAVDADQMLGLAKLRALRRLIARLGEACSVSNATEQLFVHADTSERMMTKRDPWVNILRTTMATATAAMGGARSITILPLTWALGRTDAFARRVARNTHHILIEESGLARVGDPAAGSFAIETLTADLAARTWTIFQDIEAKGGLPATLKSNFIADELRKSHEARARLLAEGRIEMTGASAFPLLGNDGITVAPWPVRPMPANQNGESMTPLPFVRMAEPFERLRDAADAFAARTGKAPSLFLATLGEPAEFAARATWIQNVLAAGGITATTAPEDMEPHRTDSAALGRAFAGSGETIACLCATDATYGERGEAAASILKQTGAKRVFVAGRPRDQEVALRAAGVDGFIYAGADRIAILTHLHDSLGVAKVA
jgi:methylmalonyl-CoA mutase